MQRVKSAVHVRPAYRTSFPRRADTNNERRTTSVSDDEDHAEEEDETRVRELHGHGPQACVEPAFERQYWWR